MLLGSDLVHLMAEVKEQTLLLQFRCSWEHIVTSCPYDDRGGQNQPFFYHFMLLGTDTVPQWQSHTGSDPLAMIQIRYR